MKMTQFSVNRKGLIVLYSSMEYYLAMKIKELELYKIVWINISNV